MSKLNLLASLGRVTVQLVQIVELSCLTAEDVNDNVIIVRDDPGAVVTALDVVSIYTTQSKAVFYLTNKGLDVSVGVCGAQHEIIG